MDVSRLAELIGLTASQALLTHLKILKAANQIKFAIRANVHPEDVSCCEKIVCVSESVNFFV